MRWFEPYTPSPDLSEVLDCRYVAATAGRHDLLPDGCIDLVWTTELGAVVCGPDTRAWSFEMPAGRHVVGVRFRPGAAPSVLGVAASSLVDRRVPLADLLGARPARVLDERLADAPDTRTRMAAMEDLLRPRVKTIDPTVALARQIAADTAAGAPGRLAARSGISSRQVRRRFDRDVGYGPAFLARIARLQRFARSAVRRPDLGLAELAAGAGYVDQSHLAKDTRAIAGRTPRELVAVLARSSVAVDVRSVQDVPSDDSPRSAA